VAFIADRESPLHFIPRNFESREARPVSLMYPNSEHRKATLSQQRFQFVHRGQLVPCDRNTGHEARTEAWACRFVSKLKAIQPHQRANVVLCEAGIGEWRDNAGLDRSTMTRACVAAIGCVVTVGNIAKFPLDRDLAADPKKLTLAVVTAL